MTDSTDGLAALRDDIDRIDDDIVDLIAERIETAEDIAAAKSSEGRDLVDEEREETVKSRYAERFERHELDAQAGSALAEFLIEVSLERERERSGEAYESDPSARN
ncbi:chorismate mutase [Halosimplex amylolyticum]|uniref:chorismate mutase n=1 Tax=Halosimplex amylolyticum TaxID=3396616 RepID=UPI003F544C1C